MIKVPIEGQSLKWFYGRGGEEDHQKLGFPFKLQFLTISPPLEIHYPPPIMNPGTRCGQIITGYSGPVYKRLQFKQIVDFSRIYAMQPLLLTSPNNIYFKDYDYR